VTIAEARAAIVAELEPLGVPVVVDVRDLQPPAIVVGLADQIDWYTVCGPQARVRVSIVAAPPGNADAGDWLSDTVEAVLRALSGAQAGPATLGTYDPGNGSRLPAYDVPVIITL